MFMFLRIMQVDTCSSIFIDVYSIPLYVPTTNLLLIHSPLGGYWGGLHSFAITILRVTFLHTSWAWGLCSQWNCESECTCLLSFTRYCQITVHSDFVNFCSPQQCEGLPLHHILDITLMLSNFYSVSLNFEIISSLQESCKNSSLYLPFRVTNLFCHICFLSHI